MRIDRFEVVAALGRGASGAIYRALDTTKGMQVALKVALSHRGAEAVQREFRLLVGLDHPGIVRALDAGEGWFSMELLQGELLSHRAPSTLHEAVRVARDVVSALAYLHARRLVHRDVKPANLVLLHDGTVKLIDFGLAREEGMRGDSAEGTIGYLAPELLRGGEVDPRSDLYSLGATLYEWAAGRAPFEDPDPQRVLSLHLEAQPPPPRSFNPSVPEPLEQAILRLLAKSPSARPQSAQQAERELTDLLATPALAALRVERGVDLLYPPAFVGRERERRAIESACERALAGGREIVVVTGPSGSGRKRLLDEVQEGPWSEDPLLLRVSCEEASATYDVFRSLLADAFLALDPAPCARASRDLGPLLAKFVPALRARLPEPRWDAPPEEIPSVLKELLALLTAERPAAVFLHGLERLDASTAELLAPLGRLLRTQRVFLAASLATDARFESCPARSAVARMQREGLVEEVPLPPLAGASLVAFVQSVLGGQRLPEEAIARLERETGGQPGPLYAAIRALAERDLLVRKGGRWQLLPGWEKEGLSLGADARALTDREVATLRALALAGSGAPAGMVRAISGQAELETSYSLAQLARRGILRRVGGVFRFVEAATEEAFLARWGREERIAAHERALPAATTGQDRVRHALGAQRHREAIEGLLERSIEAERLGAHAACVESCERALAQMYIAGKHAERRVEALERLAGALLARGDAAAAEERLREALMHATRGGAEEARLLRALAEAATEAESYAEAERAARRAVELSAAGEDREEARRLLVEVALAKEDLAEARSLLDEMASSADGAAKVRLAQGRWAILAGEWGLAISHLRQAAEGAGPRLCGEAHVALARAELARLRLSEAQASLARAEELRESATPSGRVRVDLVAAAAAALAGAMDEAFRRAGAAMESATALGRPGLQAQAGVLVAALHAWRGRGEEGRRAAELALSVAEKAGARTHAAWASWALGECLLAKGEAVAAGAAFKKGIAATQEAGREWPRATLYLGMARAARAAGEAAQAERWLARAERHALSAEDALTEGRAGLLRARMLRGTGDAEAGRHLLRAQEVFDRGPVPLLLAETTLEAATAALEAAAPLARAEDLAAALSRAEQVFRTAGSLLSAKRAGHLARELARREARPAAEGDEADRLSSEAGVRAACLREEVDRTLAKILSEAEEQMGVDTKAVMQRIDEARMALHEKIAELSERNLSLAARLDALEEERTSLSALTQVGRQVTCLHDPDRIVDAIIDIAIRELRAERGFLLLKEPDGSIRFRAARNLDRETVERPESRVSMTVARMVMTGGEPVLTSDAETDERFRERGSVSELRLKSILCVPLLSRGQVIGLIYVDNRFVAGCFTEKALDFLVAFSHQAAIALENARLYQDLARSKQELETLNKALSEKLTDAELRLARSRVDAATQSGFEGIVGETDPMLEMRKLITRVAESSVPVVLSGESGSGKELVARAIHRLSPRREKTIATVNCAAIPEGLLESELFGHVRGSFTGADRDREGLFEAADGGTLFLDEVAEMGQEMQKKLLRALQNGEIRRVGGKETKRVDVRVICASNRELEPLVREGKFREDLFYRLNVVKVRVPPLRERREDIPLLVAHFLRMLAEKARRASKEVTPAAMKLLVTYPWPGNVRELENELRRADVMAERVIDLADLSPRLRGEEEGAKAADPAAFDLKGAQERLEKDLVTRALRKTAGNRSRAAQLLGLSRQGLINLIDRHGLA